MFDACARVHLVSVKFALLFDFDCELAFFHSDSCRRVLSYPDRLEMGPIYCGGGTSYLLLFLLLQALVFGLSLGDGGLVSSPEDAESGVLECDMPVSLHPMSLEHLAELGVIHTSLHCLFIEDGDL
jgi:hypothetical protein